MLPPKPRLPDPATLEIIGFRPEYRAHFYRLNAAWLTRFFAIEPIDERVLSNPEAEIIAHGGEILFVLKDNEVVGTCALKCEPDNHFELTKMAVDEQHQGAGIGRALMTAAIARFQQRQGGVLFLETNSRLTPAIRLYESVGFEHQSAIKPGSPYARADVYMIWRDPVAKSAA